LGVISVGHGQHGDYLFGWKDDALQRGMDELGKNGCDLDVCSSALKIQPGADAVACTKKTVIQEDVGRQGTCKFDPLFPLVGRHLEVPDANAASTTTGLKELPGGVQVY